MRKRNEEKQMVKQKTNNKYTGDFAQSGETKLTQPYQNKTSKQKYMYATEEKKRKYEHGEQEAF